MKGAENTVDIQQDASVWLASYATHLLPYRGLGSGIPRTLKAWPSIELANDRAGNLFKAIIYRHGAG